ncbi:hypothetical protein LUZ60_012974 [Juncus effusus]|nr:hypothetical protein LUZ60_012974 [Juncus effusus]
MKNLKLVTEQSLQLDLLSEGESLLLSSFDIERNRLFFASSSNLIYTLHLPSSQQGTEWSKSSMESEPGLIDLEHGDSIVAMDYIMEKEALLIGSMYGSLVLYNTDEKSIEVVGRVEGGVKNIASSPDGALLSISTGLGQLLIMTHDWEVLYENSLQDQISEDNFAPNEVQNYPITWRGDGKFFATLGESNKLLIFERESGSLHSSSQPKPFTRGAIDWMPSGAKIATCFDRKSENKSPLIVFFERNGLERNSFGLEGPVEASIETLKWNSNSELLAARVDYDNYTAIKIWYFSNNHWYLKQEIRFSKEDAVRFCWDPTKPLNLICWSVTGKVYSYKFIWASAVSDANSVSLVIDGFKVLITPLSFSLMPPPLSLFCFKFRAPVVNLSCFSDNLKSLLAVSLSDGSLSVVDLPEYDKWDQFEGNEIGIDNDFLDLKENNYNNNVLHLNWLDVNTLIGVSANSLIEIEVSPAGTSWQGELKKKIFVENSTVSIVPNPVKKGSAFIQTNGGKMVEYPFDVSIRVSNELGFPSACPWMKSAVCVQNGISRVLILGLDEFGRLYLGSKIICNNCTSFAFYYAAAGSANQVATHVVFTTKQDILFVMDVSEILYGNIELKLDNYNIGNNNYYKSKESKENRDYVNIWEKGAKIIGILHGDESGVILQTNRGNLECIYARKLVLNSIINALNQNRFKDALTMVRRHRIDFNIIIDYLGLKSFIEYASDFVTQVDNLSYITEFICNIKKENVVDNLYKAYISLPKGNEDLNNNKVTSVLTAVRKALEEKLPECPSRELCILTTLAKSEPPLIEEALKRIKSVRESELFGGENAKRKNYPSSEESLKHLLWLTDSEFVYNAALGLYDLNLAAMVALNSQKDPKEFIPYLKGLEELSNPVMKYTIDLKLGRNESALRNIFLAGDSYWDNFMELLNNNPDLFPLGLQLVNETEKKQKVLEAWGDYLYSNKLFEQAATTYLCSKSYTKSMKSYRENGNWKSVLTLAGLLKFEKIKIISLANELCEEFQALGKPCEAAKISLEYLNDVDKGVNYLIIAREWEEALRVVNLYMREDLETEVVNGAVECGNQIVVECEENCVKVGKYLARYLAVRQRRLVLQAKIKSEEESNVNNLEYDSVSEISTSFSDMSAYTTRSARDSGASVTSSTARSARSARQQKKKAGKIRAGSAGEELALVDHLNQISLTPAAQREIKSLILTLLSVGKDEIALHVQTSVDTFELTQRAAVRLTEDTMGNEIIDEANHTLERYVRVLRGGERGDGWRVRALVPAQQVNK